MINNDFYEVEQTKGRIPHIRIDDNKDGIGICQMTMVMHDFEGFNDDESRDSNDDDSEERQWKGNDGRNEIVKDVESEDNAGNDENHGSQSLPHARPNECMF